MPLLLLLAVLGAAPPGQIRLAAPGLSYVQLDERQGDAYLDFFAQKLLAAGVQVVTKQEMAALIGLERQRQLVSCSEAENSCLAELAGALGTEGVISGSLKKLERGFLINLKVTHATNARSLGAYSARVGSEDELLDYLAQAGEELAQRLTGRAPIAAAPGPSLRPWIPAAAGGALVAGGAVMFGLALSQRAAIASGAPSSRVEADAMARSGRTFEVLGYAAAGAGLVGLGLAGFLALKREEPQLQVAPVPGGGAALMYRGSLP
jgi:hypothetical protein